MGADVQKGRRVVNAVCELGGTNFSLLLVTASPGDLF